MFAQDLGDKGRVTAQAISERLDCTPRSPLFVEPKTTIDYVTVVLSLPVKRHGIPYGEAPPPNWG